MINKIILFNLTDRCKTLKGEGLSYAEIARTLSDEYDKTISAVNVGRYFKAETLALSEAVSANTKLQTKKVETHLNVIQQLSDINTETLSILKDAKKSHDAKIALLAIQRVEKQLELQARLLGEIDESPKIVSINILRAES